MEENNGMNIPPVFTETDSEPKIVQTDAGAKDGQNKCPKCGATDISLNVNTGMLRCNFCRHEFEAEKVAGMETDLSKLEGMVMGSGAQDIIAGTDEVMTFKCSSCGAEVVIDTAQATQARCHWCRTRYLSTNKCRMALCPTSFCLSALKRKSHKLKLKNLSASVSFLPTRYSDRNLQPRT